MASKMGYTVLDFKAFEEGVKKRLSPSEEEPFEGDVPMHEIEKDVQAYIVANPSKKFVFDGLMHKEQIEFVTFCKSMIGSPPDNIICLTLDDSTVTERWKKKNEADEVGEEQVEEIRLQGEVAQNSAGLL
jgi:hypothetical protein